MCMSTSSDKSKDKVGIKVVKASEFCRAEKKHPTTTSSCVVKGTSQENACYNVWRHVRGPFLLPRSICSHEGRTFSGYDDSHEPPSSPSSSSPACKKSRGGDRNTIYHRRGTVSYCRASYEEQGSWEPFDFNLAGCLMCGALHVCSVDDGGCPVEISREGHSVCMITGMCVKMLSFSNDEFLDTVNFVDECCGWPPPSVSSHHHHHHAAAAAAATTTITKAQQVSEAIAGGGGGGGKRQGLAPGAASLPPPSSSSSSLSRLAFEGDAKGDTTATTRCSVNKKNRYRSWVYHRVTQPKAVPLTVVSRHGGLSSSSSSSSAPSPPAVAAADASLSPHLPGGAAAARCPLQPPHSDHMHALIHSFVYDVLCSPKWEKSISMERQKASAKKKQQQAQQQQAQQQAAPCPSYCKLVRQSFNAGRMVNAHMATKAERQRICEWCVDMIHRHMCLMNAMCKGVITEAKLRSAAVGLLYMLRQGIIVHELVVLPRLKRLEDILPLENHLDVLFGVRAKCITETENVVKIILRSVTKQQLLDAGVSEVSCRLR